MAHLHCSVLQVQTLDRIHICADLHLLPNDPIKGLKLWGQSFKSGDQVVILGDLFEAWIENYWAWDGRYAEVLKLFRQWNNRGCQVHLIMGNRDVLVGKQLVQQTGMRIHNEPLLLKTTDSKLMLIHGDELLPDDLSYQRFKYWVRQPISRFLLHCLPLGILQKCVGQVRQESIKKISRMSENFLKINVRMLLPLLRNEDCSQILGGHLHKNIEYIDNLGDREIRVRILQQSHGDKIYSLLYANGKLQEKVF